MTVRRSVGVFRSLNYTSSTSTSASTSLATSSFFVAAFITLPSQPSPDSPCCRKRLSTRTPDHPCMHPSKPTLAFQNFPFRFTSHHPTHQLQHNLAHPQHSPPSCMVCNNIPIADSLPPSSKDLVVAHPPKYAARHHQHPTPHPNLPSPSSSSFNSARNIPATSSSSKSSSTTSTTTTAATVVAMGIGVNVISEQPNPSEPVLMEFETHAPSTAATNSAPILTSSSASSSSDSPSSHPSDITVDTSAPPPSLPDHPASTACDPSASHVDPQVYDDAALSSSTVTTSSEASSTHSTHSPALSKPASDDPVSTPNPLLSFRTGVVSIPHPEKAKKGGEDAFFIQQHALGVFDGVGGWASVGVDAGLYSKELARLTSEYVAVEGPASIVEALKHATEKNRAVGSSTACVAALDGEQLLGVNLGDSGLIVIRDGRIVYRTTEQQHYFNCPFQIGTDSLDTVEAGKPIQVTLQHGDWIIMGTDGLWDNVFPYHIVDTVVSRTVAKDGDKIGENKVDAMDASGSVSSTGSDGCSAASDCSVTNDGEEAQFIAQLLAERALKVANNERGTSPFAVNAQNAGHLFLGGKIDDITIIAALVVDPHGGDGEAAGNVQMRKENGKE